MPAPLFLLACLLAAGGAGIVLCEEAAGPVYKGGRAEALTQQAHTALPTVTVRGFLNFRTTVDGTVIVFTPASEGKPSATSAAAAKRSSSSSTRIRPSTTKPPPPPPQPQTRNVLGFEIVGGGANEVLPPPTPSSTRPSSSSSSRRRPSSTSSSSTRTSSTRTSSRPQYPTGLVTVLGGTHVHRGVTTIHETKVIGTYIDGKYAQILQSTSRLVSASAPPAAASVPTPTAAFRAPEATPAARLPKLEPSPSPRQQQVIRSQSTQASKEGRLRPRKLGDTTSSSPSTALQSSFRSPEASSSSSRQLFPRRTQSLPGSKTSRFRAAAVSREPPQSDLEENTIVVTRGRHAQQRHTPLLTTAGTRLRYVPARNTHTVRLNRFKVRLTARPDASSEPPSAEEEPSAATPSSTSSPPPPAEATSADDVDPLVSIDPARVRYEATTVTSLVTLHAAQGKSVVRTLTITTSVPRTLEPSELVSNGILEGSEGPPAALTGVPSDSSEEQTPPLVVSRVYSTTEHSWRTSLVPYFDGLGTTTHTLTESFIIRKIVTAYRTMPPGDLLALDERNVTLDLDSEQYFQTLLNGPASPPAPTPQQQARTVAAHEASYLALPSDGDQPVQLANPLLNAAFNNNPLAAVYLGLQQLNQQATLYSTVTHTSVYTTTDTVFHTKLVSFYDGRRTRTRTLSESLSTTERTLTSYATTVVPYLNTQALQLQQLIGQPLTQPPAPRYSTVTSTFTTVTTATSYSSKIYTLIYNAFSTRFRTVTSSSSYVTTLTSTSTSSFLVQPTAPAFAPQLAQVLAQAAAPTVAPVVVAPPPQAPHPAAAAA